ncbi:MAG: 16S rRNA (cytosine(967)-C(5))-methyltransferase RsmB [Culicoidibacterales bacterium]
MSKSNNNTTDVRELASQIILETCYNKGYINKQLQGIKQLSPSDMSFLTNIVYGVVKDYDYLQAILATRVDLAKNKRIVRVILAMSLYQFLSLDKIPTYAIIDSAVRVARAKTNDFTATFVNAVLRKILVDKATLTVDTTSLSEIEALAIKHSQPLWLTKLLVSQYNLEEATSFYLWVSESNRQFARVNTLKASKEEILELPGFIAADGVDAVEYLLGNIAATEAFLQGRVMIQNLSSQLVAPSLNPQRGDTILDMCAAPGGKTTHLAQLTGNKATITAMDLYPFRVKQIDENAQRLGNTTINSVTGDALSLDKTIFYDRILLDAPCSGLGVLKQKPEIKYQITPTILDELVVLQRKLLKSGWSQLKVGGTFVYSTCTINKKENQKQIAQFLANTPDAKLVAENEVFAQMAEGYSGFYLATMLKEERDVHAKNG